MCFIVCSHHNGEKALVSLCLRSKMLKKTFGFIVCLLKNVAWWLCFIEFSLKQPYKVWLRIVFVDMNSPNHVFYRCKCLAIHISHCKLFKSFMLKRFEKVQLRSAAGWRWCCFKLCVFRCTPLFDCKMRTLIGQRPLLGNQGPRRCLPVSYCTAGVYIVWGKPRRTWESLGERYPVQISILKCW